MKNAIRILAAMLLAIPLAAQQPQTSTPVFRVNAKYVNGMAPGYWPTAGSGFTLNLSAGTANCSGTMTPYAGGTLTMTASTTNYVYLNTSASCVPAVKTTAFTSSDIPVATVVTSGSAITTISDDRTIFQVPGSGGGGGGGGVAWGGITGSITSQADLEAVLNAKAASPVNGSTVTSSFSLVAGEAVRANCSTSCTATLPSTVVTGFSADVINIGTASVTIASGGPTYDGVVTLPPGIAIYLFTDGTAYHSNAPVTTYSGCTFTPALTGNTVSGCGGGSLSLIPVETYSAVGYTTQSAALAGTDSTTPVQNCLNALTPGQACLITKGYKITGTLTMPTTTGIGLVGLSPSSFLITTSASADIIDDWGTSLSVRNTYHTYSSFQLYRSVTPTGTAAGISQKYTGGAIINQVGSNDSIYPFYYLGTAALGYGYTANSAASWGFNGNLQPTGPVCGFYLDTSTGVALDSFRAKSITASQNYGNATEYDGVCLVGTLMSDVDVTGLEGGVLTHGVKIAGSGSLANAFQDVHFRTLVLDECLSSCIYVSGIPNSGTYNYSAIEFNGGYVNTDNQLLWGYPNYAIDVENSSGVTFSNLQVLGSNLAGFYLNGSNNIGITGNNCKSGLASGAHGGCLLLNNSNDNAITGNIFNSVVDVAGTNASFVGSSNNTFASNIISGYNTTGVSFDSASNNNKWLQSNSIDTTNIATAFTDAGTGNEQATFSFPGAGVPCSSGSAWCTSYTLSGSGGVIPLQNSPVFLGNVDASGATSFKLPVAAAYAAAANGQVGYDSTNNNWHLWKNSADYFLVPVPTSFTSGHCGEPTNVGGSWTLVDAGGPCGVSGGGVTALFGQSGSIASLAVPTGDSINPTGTGVVNANQLNGVPFCTGFTPTTGQAVTYTTASSPNPCYTAATSSGGSGAVTNLCSTVTLTNATCLGGVISFSSMNSPGFTVSAIPGTFNNLNGHIKGACTAAANSNIIATLNSDTTTAHYNCQITAFASSTTNKSATCSASSVTGGFLLGEMGGSGGIGTTDFTIPAYADSNQKAGTGTTLESTQPLSGTVGWSWNQTSAIASIQFVTQGSCAAAGSMTLYGEQ